MRVLLLLLTFFFILSCSNSKKVYWCGDHPCINNKEKQDYFKKNMIVEVKNINKKSNAKNTNMDKIILETQKNEKKRIKEEKKIAKQIILDEKKRIKEEKKIAKRKNKELNKQKKESKKLYTTEEKSIEKASIKQNLNNFDEIMENIINKNKLKPYPDINNIDR